MARIRTIKPEFPQSESMGRVSRDARLLFVELWTLCDDEGRTRGNSRMLASLLFPYDDDAPELIDGWIAELEREGCINRYVADGSTYIEVRNWLNHQKIDKPSKSKIPPFDESSRILANPRECSSEDQGSRIKDQGRDQGEEGIIGAAAATPPDQVEKEKRPAKKSTQMPADFFPDKTGTDYAEQRNVNLGVELESFRNYHAAKGTTFKDWQAAWRTWCDKAVEFGRAGKPGQQRQAFKTVGQERAETIAYLTGKTPAPVVELPAQGQLIEGEALRVAG